jgi:hypothetical protein
MVYALQKIKHYLLGSHFNMFIDHSTLKYLVNNPMLGGGGGGEYVDGYCCFRNTILMLW